MYNRFMIEISIGIGEQNDLVTFSPFYKETTINFLFSKPNQKYVSSKHTYTYTYQLFIEILQFPSMHERAHTCKIYGQSKLDMYLSITISWIRDLRARTFKHSVSFIWISWCWMVLCLFILHYVTLDIILIFDYYSSQISSKSCGFDNDSFLSYILL